MRLLSSILLFFTILFVGSCEMINPDEPIPTYLRVDSFQFIQPTPYVGTASQKITSIWVYFDNRNVGVFDLPATIPIIAEQPGKLRVVPGVTYSGINDVLTAYPFFLSDTMTLTPAKGQIVNWTPKTGYIGDSLLNIYNVDFETGVNPFESLRGPLAVVKNEPNLVFEGSYAGYISVDADTVSENRLKPPFFASKDSYIELNYRGTIDFEIGLQSNTSTGQPFIQYLYGYKARSDWNKVYIGLQDFIGANPGRPYSVVIKVNGVGGPGGYVSFDNLKVVSRK